MGSPIETKRSKSSREAIARDGPPSKFHHAPSKQCLHNVMQGVIDQVPPPMYAMPTQANAHQGD